VSTSLMVDFTWSVCPSRVRRTGDPKRSSTYLSCLVRRRTSIGSLGSRRVTTRRVQGAEGAGRFRLTRYVWAVGARGRPDLLPGDRGAADVRQSTCNLASSGRLRVLAASPK
jgi:hypothetical protein